MLKRLIFKIYINRNASSAIFCKSILFFLLSFSFFKNVLLFYFFFSILFAIKLRLKTYNFVNKTTIKNKKYICVTKIFLNIFYYASSIKSSYIDYFFYWLFLIMYNLHLFPNDVLLHQRMNKICVLKIFNFKNNSVL